MQKLTMIVLMLCSLTYSNVTCQTKQLNDTTKVAKCIIPPDSTLYTCLDENTYINTIQKMGEGKFCKEKLGLCESSIESYKNIKDLQMNNINNLNEINRACEEFKDELYKEAESCNSELQLYEDTKWFWRLGAYATGVLSGILVIVLITK